MSLGENIHHFRTKLGMSQGDLADALEVSRQSVSKWENNSAIPELDKLIKMSNLFGITLDALIKQPGSDTPPHTSATNSKEQSSRSRASIPIQFILGVILICIAVGGVFWFCIAAWLTGHSVMPGLLLGTTLIACGILCFTTKYPYVYWGWCLWIAYVIYLFILSPRWEAETFLLILAGLFLLGLLIWTVLAQKKGWTHIPLWLQIAAGILLSAMIFLFILNITPPAPGHVTPVIPE